MADENKKTWIKQGSVDATYNYLGQTTTHNYLTTENIIDNSGIYGVVVTKDGSDWDGSSTNNIEHVYVNTTKGYGTWDYKASYGNGQVVENHGGFDTQTSRDCVNIINVENVYISDIPIFKSKDDAINYLKTQIDKITTDDYTINYEVN